MDTPAPTAADLNTTLARLRAAQQRRVPDYAQRIDDLKRLRSTYKAKLDEFAAAMSADFGRRSRHETLLSDGMTVLNEIDHACGRLRAWMRPKRAAADWLFLPARTEIRYQPLGVVGVIAPWNYPVNLALNPLAIAIAAGNHVMLKPSEHTPRTSALLQQLLVGRGLGFRHRRGNPAARLGDRLISRADAAHGMFVGAVATEHEVGVAVDQARRDPRAVERVDLLRARAGKLGALADADDPAVGDPDRAIVDDAERIARPRLERRYPAVDEEAVPHARIALGERRC